MRNRGFSLAELILCLAAASIMGIMVYKIFAPATTLAAVRNEQERTGKIVRSITELYTLESSYDGLTTQHLSNTFNSTFTLANGKLIPPATIAEEISLNAASSFGHADTIELRYHGVPIGTCARLATALSRAADFVYIENEQVKRPYGELREDLVVAQCASSVKSDLVFRFANKHSMTAPTDISACQCAPETETVSVVCETGQSGSITQRRTGTCVNQCTPIQWSSWATTANTCTANATPPPPVVAPQTPDDLCIPTQEQRLKNCPAGSLGFSIEGRQKQCPSNAWGEWRDMSSNCRPEITTTTCVVDPAVDVENDNAPCPAGQGGSIQRRRYMGCSSTGEKRWGDWMTFNSTCTASCVAAGTCCAPRTISRSVPVLCPINSYGVQSGVETQTSACATASSAAAWSGVWTLKPSQTTGSCHGCPSNTSTTITRDEGRSGSCNAGQYGQRWWQAQFAQTVHVEYACNTSAGNASPGRTDRNDPWYETGYTFGHSDNCQNCPAPYTETNENWVRVNQGCPNGMSGEQYYEKQQHQQRTVSYACPAGQTTAPAPNIGAWGGWYDTGAQRNHVNTCAATCTVENRSHRVAWQNSSTLAGLKDCNGSNIGQRAWSNYISCSGMGPCGGYFRASVCTASGWQVVAGAGSSPYVSWGSGRPAEWDALYMQGYNDAPAIGAQQGSAGVSNWITYQCL